MNGPSDIAGCISTLCFEVSSSPSSLIECWLQDVASHTCTTTSYSSVHWPPAVEVVSWGRSSFVIPFSRRALNLLILWDVLTLPEFVTVDGSPSYQHTPPSSSSVVRRIRVTPDTARESNSLGLEGVYCPGDTLRF